MKRLWQEIILDKIHPRYSCSMTISKYSLILCFFFSLHSYAQVTWDGGGDGTNWSDAANWDTGVIPGISDNVVIPDNSGSITVDSLFRIQDLTVGSGNTITISGNLILERTGGETITFINNGIIDIGSGSVFRLREDPNTFDGIAAIIDGSGTISGVDEFRVVADNGVTISANSTLSFESSEVLFFQSGSLTADSPSTVTFGSTSGNIDVTLPNATTFNNLEFDGGNTVVFEGLPDITGDFSITSGTTLDGTNASVSFVGSGTQDFDASGTLDPGIEFFVDAGAVVRLISDIDLINESNDIQVEDGGTLDFNGFNIIGNSGDFTLNSGGTLQITSLDGIDGDTDATTGNVQCNVRDFSSGGTYIYSGTVDQNTGDGLPTTINSEGGIEINNPGNTVTLNTPSNVQMNSNSTFTLTAGTFSEDNTSYLTANPDVTISSGTIYRTALNSSTVSDGEVPDILDGSGTITVNGGVELEGSDKQFVKGTFNYGSLIVNSTDTVEFTSGGNRVDTLDIITGTLDFENNGITGNVYTQSGGTAQYSGAAAFPNYTSSITQTGGTIELNGSGNQLLSGATYVDVDILSGTTSLSGGDVTIDASGDLSVASGATLRLSSVREILDGGTSTSFTLNSGATLEIGSQDGITASGTTGNVQTDNRSFPVDANYTYSGGVNDQNTGNGLPTNLTGTLTINKTTPGDTVNLSQATEVDTLVIASGILNTEAATITVDAATPIVGSSGGTTVSDFSSTNHIEGPITTSGLGTASYVFPVGDAGDYRPVTITPASAGDFTVQHVTDTASDLGEDLVLGGGTYESFLSSRFWNIIGLGSVDADVSFQVEEAADNQGEPFNQAELRVVTNSNGGTWQDIGQPTASGSPTATITINNISNTDLNGDFTLASTDFNINPLPVELLSFVGKQIGSNIRLEWATATEIDNEKFEIEHNTGEGEFTKIGQVPGNGDSDEVIEYRYVHNNPALGANFYRLKQIDFDGDFEYSDIIRVWFEQAGDFDFEVFPNPTSQYMSVQFGKNIPANSVVEVLSLSGQSMMRQTIGSDRDEFNLNVGNLSKGMYILQVNTGNEVFKSRIIKE